MIHSLNGVIVSKSIDSIVISCSGVGFKVLVPTGAYSLTGTNGDEVFLYTHLVVKEDAFELYGFISEEEQQCFKMIINVSGIGPRIGLSILSLYSPSQVAIAIASGDYKVFSACPGIGPKLAQRIILELKDKVGSLSSDDAELISAVSKDISSSKKEAQAALIALGFSIGQAATVLAKLSNTDTAEQLVSEALRSLGRS